MIEYVVGFCFNKQRSHVVLMRKKRPEWQKGHLNGVGGKIEDNESPIDAMCREFEEETGVESYTKDWNLCFELVGYDFKLFVFKTVDDKMFEEVKTTTDEEIIRNSVDGLCDRKIMYNLHWMIPMIRDKSVTFPIKLDYKGNFDG